MSKEIKEMLLDVFCKGLKASNASDEEDGGKKEEKPEVKAENGKTAKNEDVDKRDIIRQIMAIAGKREDDEDVKTIAKLAEKLAYDKSEAGTADNSKTAKNEDDEDGKKDEKEAKNKKACNDEIEEKKEEVIEKKEEKEALNKAKNSLDDIKNLFYKGEYKSAKPYMTQKQGIELGKKLY